MEEIFLPDLPLLLDPPHPALARIKSSMKEKYKDVIFDACASIYIEAQCSYCKNCIQFYINSASDTFICDKNHGGMVEKDNKWKVICKECDSNLGFNELLCNNIGVIMRQCDKCDIKLYFDNGTPDEENFLYSKPIGQLSGGLVTDDHYYDHDSIERDWFLEHGSKIFIVCLKCDALNNRLNLEICCACNIELWFDNNSNSPDHFLYSNPKGIEKGGLPKHEYKARVYCNECYKYF